MKAWKVANDVVMLVFMVAVLYMTYRMMTAFEGDIDDSDSLPKGKP